jgi:hypothetical protein
LERKIIMKRLAVAASAVVALAIAAPAAQANVKCVGSGTVLAKTCIDTTGSCTVGQYRTSPAGSGFYCLVRRPSSQRYTGPCATQRALFEKYNIQFDMHQEQVELLYSVACRRLG